MSEISSKYVLGIIGGMGPLSSAEFLRTIYEISGDASDIDQESPGVLMFSDPTYPDRTDAFLRGETDDLLAKLTDALDEMCKLGASKVVLCCMTIHYLLPRLPDNLRKRIISLMDVIYSQVEILRYKHLVICSTGTRKLRLFESHRQWEQMQDYLLFPDDEDQKKIHALIYEVKRNRGIQEMALFLEMLFAKYQATSFVVGCSEVHMLAKSFFNSSDERQEKYGCVDPFLIIARQLTERSVNEA
jgi:aspartate racemase